MKPQDLRIGNYVRIKESGKIVRVDVIKKNEVEFSLDKDKLWIHWYRYSEIEPVLIREVYEKLPTITELTWVDKESIQEVYEYKGKFLMFLHDLQNIHYAFTYNEIEIEI